MEQLKAKYPVEFEVWLKNKNEEGELQGFEKWKKDQKKEEKTDVKKVDGAGVGLAEADVEPHPFVLARVDAGHGVAAAQSSDMAEKMSMFETKLMELQEQLQK